MTEPQLRVRFACPRCGGSGVDPSGAACEWRDVLLGEQVFCDVGWVEAWVPAPAEVLALLKGGPLGLSLGDAYFGQETHG